MILKNVAFRNISLCSLITGFILIFRYIILNLAKTKTYLTTDFLVLKSTILFLKMVNVMLLLSQFRKSSYI